VLERLGFAPPPIPDELISSWIWRLARANSVTPLILFREAGYDPPSIGDIDTAPGNEMVRVLARLTRIHPEAVQGMALPPAPDLVRPRRRTAFCPVCWSAAIDAGKPLAFTRHGARVWQFLCPTHGSPLLSGPRGLWLRPPSGTVRDILKVMALELRHFLNASQRLDAAKLQGAVQELLMGSTEAVAETLLRIAAATGRPFDRAWFRALEMPVTSPPPVPPAVSLLDTVVENRRAHYYMAAGAIISGRLPPLPEKPHLPNFIIGPDQVRADRFDFLTGEGHYDPPIRYQTTFRDLAKAYHDALGGKGTCPRGAVVSVS
jgi:hypothetical protein